MVFPSLYEGFGLPVLEAMSLSTATLTSDHGALREVAGDAALLVKPEDVDSIRRGCKHWTLTVLWSNPSRPRDVFKPRFSALTHTPIRLHELSWTMLGSTTIDTYFGCG